MSHFLETYTLFLTNAAFFVIQQTVQHVGLDISRTGKEKNSVDLNSSTKIVRYVITRTHTQKHRGKKGLPFFVVVTGTKTQKETKPTENV